MEALIIPACLDLVLSAVLGTAVLIGAFVLRFFYTAPYRGEKFNEAESRFHNAKFLESWERTWHETEREEADERAGAATTTD